MAGEVPHVAERLTIGRGVAVLLALLSCVDPTKRSLTANEPVMTDSTSYRLNMADQATVLVSVKNMTDRTFYFAHCGAEIGSVLERFVSGSWSALDVKSCPAYGQPETELKSGEQRAYQIAIGAGPTLPSNVLNGQFRLVLSLYTSAEAAVMRDVTKLVPQMDRTTPSFIIIPH